MRLEGTAGEQSWLAKLACGEVEDELRKNIKNDGAEGLGLLQEQLQRSRKRVLPELLRVKSERGIRTIPPLGYGSKDAGTCELNRRMERGGRRRRVEWQLRARARARANTVTDRTTASIFRDARKASTTVDGGWWMIDGGCRHTDEGDQ